MQPRELGSPGWSFMSPLCGNSRNQFLQLQYGVAKNYTLRASWECYVSLQLAKQSEESPTWCTGTRSAKGPGRKDWSPGNVILYLCLRAGNLAAPLEFDFFSLPTYKLLPSSAASSLNISHRPHLLSVGRSPPSSSLGSRHLLTGLPSQLLTALLLSTALTSNALPRNRHPVTFGAGVWPTPVGWPPQVFLVWSVLTFPAIYSNLLSTKVFQNSVCFLCSRVVSPVVMILVTWVLSFLSSPPLPALCSKDQILLRTHSSQLRW